MLRSLTIRCNEPPNVIVDLMATLGPSVPHLFWSWCQQNVLVSEKVMRYESG